MDSDINPYVLSVFCLLRAMLSFCVVVSRCSRRHVPEMQCIVLNHRISPTAHCFTQALGAASGGSASNWTNEYAGVEGGCSYCESGGHIFTKSTITWTLNTAQKQKLPCPDLRNQCLKIHSYVLSACEPGREREVYSTLVCPRHYIGECPLRVIARRLTSNEFADAQANSA